MLTMLFDAIGCNLAWRLVDAVMYLMAILMERGLGVTTSAFACSREARFHRSEFERLRRELERARGASTLPETLSAEPALEDLLVRLRSRA